MLDDEIEPHFFSGIDGSLYSAEYKEFYSNDNFCVDYFYSKDELDPEIDEIKVSIPFYCAIIY